MIYLDTSVLGAVFFRESGGERIVRELKALRNDGLVISAWSLTEVASVGAIKERTGAIDRTTRQTAMAHFQRFVSARLALTEVEPADFRAAATLIAGPYPVRAGDALHLAIARRLQARLGSLDRQQRVAAEATGISVVPLGDG